MTENASTMQNNEPRQVDVIIAAWNRADTIERAIASALAEPEVNSVFVIDDASTDNTAARAVKADDGSGRLHVERLSENGGPSVARNCALQLARASWITILDGDDFILPGRFAALLSFANDADMVADDLLQIDEHADASEARHALASRVEFEPWFCRFDPFILGNISQKGKDRKELGFFKPIIRRDFLSRHGLSYDPKLRLGEDYALYARALGLGARLKVVPAQGYVSVVRANSLSAKHSQHDLACLRDSDLDLARLPGLSAASRQTVLKHYRSIDAKVQWLEAIEAVKARNPKRFGATFLRSFDVTRYVLARLLEQAIIRGGRRLSKTEAS